jgi:hypothetical protein
MRNAIGGRPEIELRMQDLETAVTHFLEDAPGALTRQELAAVLEIAHAEARAVSGPRGDELRQKTAALQAAFEKAAGLRVIPMIEEE